MKKTKWLIYLLVFALIAAALSGCQMQQPEEDTKPPAEEQEIKRQIELYGTVDVRQSLNISLDKTVEIVDVFVKDGQVVKKGDALFSVSLDSLKRDAALLEQKIDVAKKQLEDNNFNYQKANVSVRQLKNKLADAESNLSKNKQLLAAGAISKKEYDVSAQLVTELKNNLSAARLDVGSVADKDDQAAQLKAIEIAEYQRQYDEIMDILGSELLVGDTIVSPLDKATVTQLRLTRGAYLAAFNSAMLLNDLNSLVIKATVIEEQISSIKKGQTVTINPIMDETISLTGKIDFISSEAKIVNNETVVPLEITFDDKDRLMPNLNVDVVVPLEDE